MLQLRIKSDAGEHEQSTDKDDIVLGRAPDNDVVLADGRVSRQHARLVRRGDELFVEDLGGANGTLLNGRELHSETSHISPGDSVVIGPFTVQVNAPGAPAQRPNAEAHPVLEIQTPTRTFSVRVQRDEVSLGRGSANDIPVEAATVSQHHAIIRHIGARWEIVDLHSSNGTTVSGKPVEEALLSDGEVIQLAGSVTIRFILHAAADDAQSVPAGADGYVLGPGPNPRSDQPEPGGQTLDPLMWTPRPRPEYQDFDEAATSLAGAGMAGMSHPGHTLAVPRLTPIPDGATQLRIGRGPANDFVLDSPQVSREHALLERTTVADPWTIRDLGSTNRTYVNNVAITTKVLQDGDLIRIGPFRIELHGEAIEQFDETSGIVIEALHLSRIIGKGKTILEDVSLYIRPRELVAVVGGSGAGKSTLLNALSGLRPATKGDVLFNGYSLYTHFASLRAQIGFVPQDDIIHRELTVERALDYAAELRMPVDTSPKEREQRLDEVLDELGLTAHRKTIVSSLSGGQRKRVSIGVELLTKPPLFYLDEPTSGLDPGTETRAMALLRQLADQGRTVILITHATRNISMCDRVVFMGAGGRLAFFGSPRDALGYFQVKEFEDIYDVIENQKTGKEWQQHYLASPLYESEIGSHITDRAVATEFPDATATAAKVDAGPETSSKMQFSVLTRRYANIVMNDRRNLLILLLQAPLLGFLLWALFPRQTLQRPGDIIVVAQQGNTSPRILAVNPKTGTIPAVPANTKLFAFQDTAKCRAGVGQLNIGSCDLAAGNGNANAIKAAQLAFILAAIAVWLGTLNAIREISKEDAIYRRERLVNLRILPYILSKFVILLALVVVQSTLLALVTVLHIDFGGTGALLGTWLSLVLGGAASIAIALSISAAVSNPDRAVFAAPLVMLPQILFAGLLAPIKDLGPAQPLGAIVAARWTYEAIGRVAGVDKVAVIPSQFSQLAAVSGTPLLGWSVLIVFVGVFGALAVGLQKMKDKRT